MARVPRARRVVGNMSTNADRLRPHTLESRFLSKRTYPRECSALLQANLGHPAHRFWSDEKPWRLAWKIRSALGGPSTSEGCLLLGLAMHQKGKLATMNRAIRALLPDRSPD